jgi:predicted enzyme related to lactoylglutathione lyase
MLQTLSQTRSQAHGKFIWCELMTTDTRAAGEFYRTVLGWNVEEMAMPGADDAPPYYVFGVVEASGCAGVAGMMTIPPELEGRVPPNWTGYVAVDDVDETASQFEEAGGQIRREPQDIPGVGRFAVVADPHGAVLCIMAPQPGGEPPPEPTPDAPGTLGWCELYAEDAREAFDFYEKVFGWTVDHDMDMGPLGIYRIFAHGGRQVGGMMTRTPDIPMACWSYYFNAEAIGAAIARLTSAGGSVVHGPMEVPGGAWIVQAKDPQGAHFALVAPRR